MSMNLHLCARIDAVSKVGNHVITDRFDLLQTPTDVTRACLRSNDPKQVYLDWAKQWDNDDVILEYDFDDFEEKTPIGSHIHNYYKIHKDALESWLEAHKGWELDWFEL